jgi:hypothetical protein
LIEEADMQSFDIYFLGEMLPDADSVKVRQGVAKLFKVQEDAVERLFSGKPLRVKQGVDAETASRYRAAFRDIGALIQIVPNGSPPPAARDPASPAEAGAAHKRSTPPPPDADQTPPLPEVNEAGAFDLAEPGAIIDPRAPPPVADIDTGSLEALPPNSGSLEDCRDEKPPRPIPDISHLKLVDD